MSLTENVTPIKPKFKPKKQAVYVDYLPPCNQFCPTGANIQAWLQALKARNFRKAFDIIAINHPFPSIMGRVCYHKCESGCNRAKFDSAVNIHALERFIGDLAIAENWQFTCDVPLSTKKVLIVGAGPSGLAAAYHLRKSGIDVTIYEVLSKAGGMLRMGIPSYRLPRNILDSEIQRILNMGVKIEYNHKVTDIVAEKEQGGFDAVFLSIGAHLGKKLTFPHDNSVPIIDAVEYLHKNEIGAPPPVNGSLVVYGGGNTAIDVTRVALRNGVKNVSLVYHRSQEKMPAFPAEVTDALEEKVNFRFLRTIVKIENNIITLAVNELDEKGAPKPTGQTEAVSVEMLVLALSQVTDVDFLRKAPQIELTSNGTITVDDNFMTGYPGVFAGGDIIPYDRSATAAVGHGKHAARSIVAFLKHETYVKPSKHPLADFGNLHITSEKSPQNTQQHIAPDVRTKSFVEVAQGLSSEQAYAETDRCFSCGNCFECDGCYLICPVKAITKLGAGKRYVIDYEKCIGCGKCFKRCPCGAIAMRDNLT